MEPSVEEEFSFLDLEDCDAEDKNYLNAILGGTSGSVALTTGSTDASNPKSLTVGISATGHQTTINIRNAHLTQSLERRASEAYQFVDKKLVEATENTPACTNTSNRGMNVNSGSTVPEKPNNSVASNRNPIVLATPRGILGGQRPVVYQENSQTPQPVKVKPIQKTPTSVETSNYLADASQVRVLLCCIAQCT